MINNYDTKNFEQFNNPKDKTSVENFHKQRVAFIILDNDILYLQNSRLSHLQWAQSIGINESKFNSLTRGYVLNNNIVFYKGNFDFDDHVIEDAYKYANSIKSKLSLNQAKVYAGLIIGEVGTIYPPQKHLFDL